jgi:hypothetical protein
MGLKDVIAEDVDGVFFNTDEFAEVVTIDGREVPVILDNDILDKKSGVFAALSDAEELIFIRAADLKRMPNPGDGIKKGGVTFFVRPPVVNNMGVYELRIGRNKVKGAGA